MKSFILLLVALLLNAASLQANCDLNVKFSYKTRGLTASFTDRSVGDYDAVTWTFSDGSSTNEAHPKHTFAEAGMYNFSLTIFSNEGCSETFEGKVYVFKPRLQDNPTPVLVQQNNTRGTEHSSSANNEQHNNAINIVATVANSPNPFRASTNITFELKETSEVRVSVFDTNGRLVRIVANEVMYSGQQRLLFDRNRLRSGTYVVVVDAKSERVSHKMIIS